MCDFWLDNKNEWATLCVCVCVCVHFSTTASYKVIDTVTQTDPVEHKEALCSCLLQEWDVGWVRGVLSTTSRVRCRFNSLISANLSCCTVCAVWEFKLLQKTHKFGKLSSNQQYSSRHTIKRGHQVQVGRFRIALGEFHWYPSYSPSVMWLCNCYCLCYLECATETKIETMSWNNDGNEWKMKCAT